MDYKVTLEAGVMVYEVSGKDEATKIAISKTGDMLNPDLDYVEIETVSDECSECGHEQNETSIVAGRALVGLELSMDVFNVEDGEHAERVAKKEIGQQVGDVPLSIVETTQVDEEE
jgi:uncharacterized protein (UPF0212 family)